MYEMNEMNYNQQNMNREKLESSKSRFKSHSKYYARQSNFESYSTNLNMNKRNQNFDVNCSQLRHNQKVGSISKISNSSNISNNSNFSNFSNSSKIAKIGKISEISKNNEDLHFYTKDKMISVICYSSRNFPRILSTNKNKKLPTKNERERMIIQNIFPGKSSKSKMSKKIKLEIKGKYVKTIPKLLRNKLKFLNNNLIGSDSSTFGLDLNFNLNEESLEKEELKNGCNFSNCKLKNRNTRRNQSIPYNRYSICANQNNEIIFIRKNKYPTNIREKNLRGTFSQTKNSLFSYSKKSNTDQVSQDYTSIEFNTFDLCPWK